MADAMAGPVGNQAQMKEDVFEQFDSSYPSCNLANRVRYGRLG